MLKKTIIEFLQKNPNSSVHAIMNGIAFDDEKELKSLLIGLVQEKLVHIDANKNYSLSLKRHEIIGVFQGNKKGFGFIKAIGKKEDYYVYYTNQKNAIDGDLVLGVVTRKAVGDKKAEAKVVKILTPDTEKYMGTFFETGVNGYVEFDNQNIDKKVYISKKERNHAKNGDKVVFKIKNRDYEGIRGVVVEILGNEKDVGMDITAIAYKNDIPISFSTETLKQLENIPHEVSDKELVGRLDLRNELIITVDGDDSKDLDDAVSLSILPNGNYYLGVHIADVAHYVKEGETLDEEARERGTSVYLVDRVIPMLPPKLSNGICSLNPNVDRLTLSCFMEVDESGNVINSRICESVINSKARMTYNNVYAILQGDVELRERYKEIVPMLENMEKLTYILMDKRDKRGSIDFEFKETKVILDAENKPIQIKEYERNIATKLIEEFMILANETVSETYSKLKIPFIYRVHPTPEGRKLEFLKQFLMTIKLPLISQGKMKAKDLQQILKECKNTEKEFVMNHVVLRSLTKARYDVENIEHFGLASKYYSHFTSPIRRYPDLQIHRIIKEHLRGELTEERKEHYKKILPHVAENSTTRELKAQEAERDSVELKICEYMSDKIGEIYEAIVVGLTEYGVYVRLDNTVEGLVHISKFADYYEFDEENYCLVGQLSGKKIELGNKIKVKLVKVNVEKREIDFDIVDKI